VATVLLTLDASETSEDVVMTLVANAVNWVSPVDAPRVLFVRDDFHHGEFAHETQLLFERLAASGYRAEFLDEPEHGVTAEALAGFDVVWFSNPGYPMDDEQSFDALLEFSEAGGGVVLQGDDISWSFGHAFSTSPLTRLSHIDNGTRYCGQRIDNGVSGSYRVEVSGTSHPVIAGLEGYTFLYGDDIDSTRPLDDSTEVLVWATANDAENCARKPVVSVFTPE
jgi:hypothetical protein